MRHHNRIAIGINATQPLTASRKVRVKSPSREPTISRYVADRIRIEHAHDQDAEPAFIGEAIRLEMETQGHDHVCIVCGQRLLDEMICPACGTVPESVRQAKRAMR